MSATIPGAASPPPISATILAQRYQLERRLAQGGMAEVWLATDLALTRQVAVKLLKPALAADPVVAERFRREAVAVAQLSHSNIVAVYDAIEDTAGSSPRLAVVMQLVNGKSLRQLLDEQRRLSPDLTIHIGSCMAAALDAAHRAGLVHRDVKPGNILITPDGRVLLTDFGIAKGLGATGDDLTSANVMMGTAKYLSPEQVRGKKLDGRADLYSLGLVLYECLAGRVPFLGETDTDTALARLNRDPTDLARLRPTLPYGLAELIHRLLARRPMDRFATGAELKVALAQIATRGADPHDATNPELTAEGRRPTGEHRALTGPGPTAVGGYRPVSRSGHPVGPAQRSDRTPTSTSQPRQRPNRTFEQRRGPSMILVGGLLAAALVLGGLLWTTLHDSSHNNGFAAPPTVVPASTTTAAITPSAKVVKVTTYDPDGTDGQENDNLASLAIDGNPATVWSTVCYGSRTLGGKQGVGIIADLGSPAIGTFTVFVASAPYQVQILTAGDGAIPAQIADWGAPLKRATGADPEAVTVSLSKPSRYVLVLFKQLAKTAECTKNPYRGDISEMTFVPS
ncbi:MAG: eukaryotic-like serine/threonine-protein kinase [Ilumatobacteraceae bacterium]